MAHFTLSLEEGEPIARIEGGNYEKYKYLRIKRHEKEMDSDDEDNLREFRFPDGCKLTPLMIRQVGDHPNRCFLGGASLCGKSWLSARLAEDYQEQFPENRIYMFSALEQDDNFDNLENFYRINCDDIVEDPIDIQDLSNSLTIFDDINAFPDKEVVKEVNRLRDQLLATGRQHGTDVITTAQITLDGKKTQGCIINNMQYVGFPKSGGRHHLASYCKTYLAMDADEIKKVLKVPSRWVLLNRTPPLYVLHERGCWLLD